MATSGINAYPVGPTSGGKIYAFNNVSTTPEVVAPANVARQSITFHNPGANNIYIAPSIVQALNSVGGTITNQNLTPSLGALGGCFVVGAGGGFITLTGECQGAYQAFATTGTTNALTVSDNNV